MHKIFKSLDELFSYIKVDKEWNGAEAGSRNRYPIRFILFDNFADFNEFINNRPMGIYKFSIEDMIDKKYPDIFPTYTELSATIKQYVNALPANDYVLFPFSEMTRFYKSQEFSSLVTTIKGIEPSADAQEEHIRIYIPIVGMQNKMSKFIEDQQTFVWEYKTTIENEQYKLIIVNGTTYNVSGLEKNYTIVNNLWEWLKLWEKGEDVKQSIICTSKTIFANVGNAQPDNAFYYEECHNAYEFLTKGLMIDFNGIVAKEEDMPMWEKLSSLIDLEDTFEFKSFINERFDKFNIKNSTDFIKTWFECETDFDRWFLALYFRKISNNKGYVCDVLNNCNNLSTSELFSSIATHIFDDKITNENIKERRLALIEAA